MNNLMSFEGNYVEVFEFKGNILFNPYHVGKCLDIEDVTVRRHIQDMDADEVIKIKNSDVTLMNIRKLNNAGENFLTKEGVFALVFKSRKPEALKFQKWVTKEVLPSIQEKGHYTVDSDTARQNAIAEGVSNITNIATLELVQMLVDGQKELIEKNTALTTKIEEDKPLVNYASSVLKSKDCVLIRDVAKLLCDNGTNIGEKRLYKQLRDWGLIFKNSTEPMQSAINNGYFVVEQYTVDTAYGIKLCKTTKVTPKGQVYIAEKFKNMQK